MFKKSHFSLLSAPEYPPFFRIVQSVYSHHLGNPIEGVQEHQVPYSALLTFGLWRNYGEYRSSGMSLCSVLHKKINDPSDLIRHIKNLKEDYLNKSLQRSDCISRPANELIVERNRNTKGSWSLHGVIKDYQFFFPELNGGDDINNRLIQVLPKCKNLYLMQLPDSDELRADDRYLLGMLGSFPSAESYPLAAALMQGVSYCTRMYL